MSWICHHNLMLLPTSYHANVTLMTYSFHTHVILMACLCHTDVMLMSITCLAHVIQMSCLYHTHVNLISCTCHDHLRLMSWTCQENPNLNYGQYPCLANEDKSFPSNRPTQCWLRFEENWRPAISPCYDVLSQYLSPPAVTTNSPPHTLTQYARWDRLIKNVLALLWL